MNYVLGIDGGGSKTVCVLMDENRQVVSRGEAGASNYQSIGIATAKQSIEFAIMAATDKAVNITKPITISAICLGLAGVGRKEDIEVIKSVVKDLQNSQLLPINWTLPTTNILICHDALIALVGGTGNSVGIVTAAGTGSIIFGRNHQRITKRVGGWGYILGDEGSAYRIAIAGVQAALKAYDGSGMPTSLIDIFKVYLELSNLENLVELIYRRGWGVTEIAALAEIVDLAAALGDRVANQIIDDAVQYLVVATSTVIDKLFSDRPVLEVVTTGSVWTGKAKMHQRFTASLNQNFPEVKVIFPKHEPAYGAGLLALQKLQHISGK
ncbi:ATPase [Calothrix sp. FACHB-1219]|uniref:N-acetylglucosamine kinase n=1 Tax=unclassified Calothrix TaxID=2619626 RepID=UPI001683EC9C|nr:MULTISPECIES: BadF/BadG/BcrA/BcrD ATPase family protein [unclassified Calothrix]MBD2202091.1 ATPase [Calothrix sp. FACHB-168]MBD2217125.1 ATPase [Calothrix sp. FACHB-1219]